MLPSNMLLLNLILLIEVTFSTPTGDYTHDPTITKMKSSVMVAHQSQ